MRVLLLESLSLFFVAILLYNYSQEYAYAKKQKTLEKEIWISIV